MGGDGKMMDHRDYILIADGEVVAQGPAWFIAETVGATVSTFRGWACGRAPEGVVALALPELWSVGYGVLTLSQAAKELRCPEDQVSRLADRLRIKKMSVPPEKLSRLNLGR